MVLKIFSQFQKWGFYLFWMMKERHWNSWWEKVINFFYLNLFLFHRTYLILRTCPFEAIHSLGNVYHKKSGSIYILRINVRRFIVNKPFWAWKFMSGFSFREVERMANCVINSFIHGIYFIVIQVCNLLVLHWTYNSFFIFRLHFHFFTSLPVFTISLPNIKLVSLSFPNFPHLAHHSKN